MLEFYPLFGFTKNYHNSRLNKRARVERGTVEGRWGEEVYRVTFWENEIKIDEFIRENKGLALMNAREFVKRKMTYRISD